MLPWVWGQDDSHCQAVVIPQCANVQLGCGNCLQLWLCNWLQQHFPTYSNNPITTTIASRCKCSASSSQMALNYLQVDITDNKYS